MNKTKKHAGGHVVTICGVDGTGKTTLIQKIQESGWARTRGAKALRTPQYHANENVPAGLAAVSRAADQLGFLADEIKTPALKAAALFLAMSLTGDVIASIDAPVLILERDPFLDTMAYASLYLGELKRAGGMPPELMALLEQKLGAENLGALTKWIGVLHERFTGSKKICGFPELMSLIASVFNGDLTAQMRNIERVFKAEPARQTVVLTASSTLLEQRLKMKAAAGAREFHEEAGVLVNLQDKYFLIAKTLEFAVTTVSVDGLTVDETFNTVIDRLSNAVG